MVNCIATCGDSFGTGSGLDVDVCFEKSFAGVTAEHFNLPQLVYARGGCCNFTIFLQVKKVLSQIEQDRNFKPIVVITTTNHERMIIPIDDGLKYVIPDISQVDYKSYMPYDPKAGNRPVPFESGPTRLLTQTITNVDLLLKTRTGSMKMHFEDVEIEKLETLGKYYSDIFDTAIKKEYDNAIIVYMHLLLKNMQIPHVILGYQLPSVIDQKNKLEIMWGHYSKLYPDKGGSGHCDEVGNKIVGDILIWHIHRHNLI